MIRRVKNTEFSCFLAALRLFLQLKDELSEKAWHYILSKICVNKSHKETKTNNESISQHFPASLLCLWHLLVPTDSFCAYKV